MMMIWSPFHVYILCANVVYASHLMLRVCHTVCFFSSVYISLFFFIRLWAMFFLIISPKLDLAIRICARNMNIHSVAILCQKWILEEINFLYAEPNVIINIRNGNRHVNCGIASKTQYLLFDSFVFFFSEQKKIPWLPVDLDLGWTEYTRRLRANNDYFNDYY